MDGALRGHGFESRWSVARAVSERVALAGVTSASFVLTLSSGHSLDLSDPRPQDIRVEDIAAALSKICRFGAQPTSFYSVAQHAVEVAAQVPDELRLAALHHDSHEAFAGDIPTPLKELIRARSDVYDRVCAGLDAAIAEALGIDSALFKHWAVKEADRTVVVMESRDLLSDGGLAIRAATPERDWTAVGSIHADGVFGRCLTPGEAEQEFLRAHAAYAGLFPRPERPFGLRD